MEPERLRVLALFMYVGSGSILLFLFFRHLYRWGTDLERRKDEYRLRKAREFTATYLRTKFEADLLFLQTTCDHPELTDWLSEQWAPGHGTGHEVRVCSFCEKVVERRETPKVPATVTESTTQHTSFSFNHRDK